MQRILARLDIVRMTMLMTRALLAAIARTALSGCLLSCTSVCAARLRFVAYDARPPVPPRGKTRLAADAHDAALD